MNKELTRLHLATLATVSKIEAIKDLTLYNDRIIGDFNEWVRDHYDSFKCDDIEACADEILYNFFPQSYLEKLKEFVKIRQLVFADQIDDYGYRIDELKEEEE